MTAFETDAEATLPASEPQRPSVAVAADDIPTLMAAGILAYVAETLLHEAVGHGGACLAQGNSVTLLAPLYMRCSQVSPLLTAAGPVANVAGAILYVAWLRLVPPRAPLAALLLWLGFAFNALVACGYLCVGAITGFGDWASLFAWVTLPVLWRLPATLIGIAGYIACLRLAAALFRRFSGGGAGAQARLWHRAMFPAAGAALVATLAELAGGRLQPLPLLLALGCTLGVGLSLTSMHSSLAEPAPVDESLGPVARSAWLIGGGSLIAAVFIGVIGPGFTLRQ